MDRERESAQVFHPAMNALARGSLAVVGLAVVTGSWVLVQFNRSPWMSRIDVVVGQPVPFSHQHHVEVVGIDCRYCHATVEFAPYAGMPDAHTCMTCHVRVLADSPMLEPVRRSYETGEPIRWTRVYDLPDFVYFDHSIHVRKGVGCASCHGRIDEMPLTWRATSLHMDWCLDCHRNPERQVRPREAVFDMDWTPPGDREALGRQLMERYRVKRRTGCSTCHR